MMSYSTTYKNKWLDYWKELQSLIILPNSTLLSSFSEPAAIRHQENFK